MIKEAIKKIKTKTNLSKKEMVQVFNEIMEGMARDEDIKEFLLSLKAKGESVDEIVAAAEVMREKALKIETSVECLVDTCGTGGAPKQDINISTLVAIILAACGVKVAKHGNRSFSGKCGSADLLEELGLNIHMNPEKVARLIDEIGFGFIFAQDYHPAMKNVAEARRELKTRTIFNIIGPLSNPAGANMQILGVYHPDMTEIMAEALKRLGAKRAFIVHGLEGFDEISIKGKTKASELKDGNIKTFDISPSDFGIAEGTISEVIGGDRSRNASAALNVLRGKKGVSRDMVLINVAAALKMVGKVDTFKEGIKKAAQSIDSGRALEKLNRLKELTNG